MCQWSLLFHIDLYSLMSLYSARRPSFMFLVMQVCLQHIFSFHLSVFISPSYLKDSFGWCKILSWQNQLFLLLLWRQSFHCLLDAIICDDESAINFTRIHLWVMIYFSLVAFKSFYLSFSLNIWLCCVW